MLCAWLYKLFHISDFGKGYQNHQFGRPFNASLKHFQNYI